MFGNMIKRITFEYHLALNTLFNFHRNYSSNLLDRRGGFNRPNEIQQCVYDYTV